MKSFDSQCISLDGFPGENVMNPHAIVEFSWTTKLEPGTWKLKQQLTDHIHDQGTVKLEFVIKAKHAVLDCKVPLSGCDVLDSSSKLNLRTKNTFRQSWIARHCSLVVMPDISVLAKQQLLELF